MYSEDPAVSLRNAGLEVGMQRTAILRFLREDLNLFPYRLQRRKHINDKNKIKRIAFVQHYRNKLYNDSMLLKQIVLFDECLFTPPEKVNKESCRIWGSER